MKQVSPRPFSLIAWMCPVLALACGARATAQCTPQWLPGAGVPGTDDVVYATTMWDPDGAGPAMPLLVVGGSFTIAGGVAASGIATYDLQSGAWSMLGSGINGDVSALAVLPNGDLVVGGSFATAGGVAASCIARSKGFATTRPSSSEVVVTPPTGRAIKVVSFGLWEWYALIRESGHDGAPHVYDLYLESQVVTISDGQYVLKATY